MDFGLHGKIALVLGAGSGLGAAIARSLACEGAIVVLAGRHAQSVEKVAGEIIKTGGMARAVEWDISDLSAVDERVTEIEKGLGPVEILVNNTGGPPPTPAAGQDVAVWEAQYGSMVLPVIAITDRVLPRMRQRRWGRIITSTSSGVVSPIPNLAMSNALRLSLVGWSKTLAHEVGVDGVTANVVLPGRIATERIQFLDEQKARRDNRDVAQISAESTASIPAGRYGNPEEYGAVVAFIASQQASYVTGSVIRVDGGFIQSI
jgi:3-oxoacyl-[acyl-carrier protein] reductase